MGHRSAIEIEDMNPLPTYHPMPEFTQRIYDRMKAAFEGDDVARKNIELSRGAHEIERLSNAYEALRIEFMKLCETDR